MGYKEFKAEQEKKVRETKSTRFSRGEFTDNIREMINDPNYEATVYGKDEKRSQVTVNPSKELRDSLKPIVKSFGVDSAELGKMDTLEFPKKFAEAIGTVALHGTKGYIDTGRTVALPITGVNESEMKFGIVTEPTKVRETKKPVQKADGSYESVPTGNIVTTAEHQKLKAKNSTPFWLKNTSTAK